MKELATTPNPPYYAVIFTSKRCQGDDGYGAAAEHMMTLAQAQPGFLGVESARESIGITVSYWQNLEAISAWRAQIDHLDAQKQGRERWYAYYSVRIAKVERQYDFTAE